MIDLNERRAFQLRALFYLALLLIVPILNRVGYWFLARQPDRQASLVRSALEVELAIQRLSSDFEKSEADVGTYLLRGTGGEKSVTQLSTGEVRDDLAKLNLLMADNPAQKQQLANLTSLLDQAIAIQTSAKNNTTLDLNGVKAALDRREEQKSSIEALIQESYASEERIIRARENGLNAARSRLQYSIFFGYGIIALVVAAYYRDVSRFNRRTAEAESRLATLNSELDSRVKEGVSLLEARENLLTTFVEHTPTAMAMVDRDMKYMHASKRWASFFGMTPADVIGKGFYEVFPDIPDRWVEIHRRCLAGETLRAEEDRWESSRGTTWLRWEICPWGEREGRPEGILLWAVDITARKLTEEQLRESEATTRMLLDTAAQAIIASDGEGTIVLANRMAGSMYGYDPEELIGMQKELLVPERLRARFRDLRTALLRNVGSVTIGSPHNLIGLRKDGSEFSTQVNLSSVQTREGVLAVSFISDVTLREKVDEELREREDALRALTGSLLTAQEDERRNLARELHDDVMQRLAFFSIELGTLADVLPESATEALDKVQRLQRQALRTSSEVQRISRGLHPSIIADFGLSIALEAFCEEFEKLQGVEVSYQGPAKETRISAVAATALYRIAQESMRNAAIHGRATQIHVALRKEEANMQLQVSDNGIGFSPSQAKSHPGIGITSMKERTRLLNGTLDLHSEPGQGAVVTASVPFEGPECVAR